MKYLLLFFCLVSRSLFAETIGNVEYHLPNAVANQWEISNQLKCEDGSTVIYVPRGVQMAQVGEFFAVNSNPRKPNLEDSAILGVLKNMYGNLQIDLKILERTKSSVLFEWSAKEKGEERIHGWSRIFSTKDGTVILGYQTEKSEDVAKARSLWLPVMKNAKQIGQ